MPDDLRIAAVVVAFDRRELLTASLDALASQTRALDAVVVVDNASSDGSGPAALAVAAATGLPVDLLTLPRNTGGAGGFAAGTARALAHACAPHGPSLLWLLDDDTVPSPTALAELLSARERWTAAGLEGPAGAGASGAPSDQAPALLASRVVWTDGREHPMNTPRRKPLVRRAESERAAAAGAVPVRSASFVSVLLDAGVVADVGLPLAAYFLWNDDFELTTRVLRGRYGLHVGASVVEHCTKTFGGADADPGARFRFEVRNKLWMFTRSTSLSPLEKALYGASTLRRWAKAVAGSSDRGLLARSALAGVVEGVRAPASTTAVLARLGPVSDDVALVEAAARGGRGAGGSRPSPPSATASRLSSTAPSTTGEPFSLLLPVYGGDRPAFLAAAFASATSAQTRPPAEVVLVRDGPLPKGLAEEVERLVAASPVPVVQVPLPRNVGLAMALEAGLEACSHDLVARMDADDVALPQRFAVQVPLLEAGADLVGSALEELDDDEAPGALDAVPGAVRRQPPDAAWIASRARFHSPFNHPTVVYRRSAVAAAGGYRTLPLLEDYWLFTRMIAAGAVCANVPDVLLRYRVSSGSYQRRGGWRLLRSELTLQRHLLAEGFVTPAQFGRNVVVRAGYRAVPVGLRRLAYRAVFTARNPGG